MAGYESGDFQRYNSELMDGQLERVIYKPWFQQELVKLLGPGADIRKVRLWLGPCGCYWLRAGKIRKYVTVVFTHDTRVLAVEQDGIHAPDGVVCDFTPSS